MAKEITRYIQGKVKLALWGRAAGRCQFNGCNRPLYQSPITKETVNISEAAHIYSFSKEGPRGWGPLITNKKKLNEIDNLMLMCHDCHKTIDEDKKGDKYSASLLQHWKKEHEQRIWTVTGIALSNKSHVVFYGANIGVQKSPLQKSEAISAMFPHKYPANEEPIRLSMSSSLEDRDNHYWAAETEHLSAIFQQQIVPLIDYSGSEHFSLFALAPMPLLIKLGALFTDKISVDAYQPIREPKTWQWQDEPDGFDFHVKRRETKGGTPVLILSLSAEIGISRVTDVLGEYIDIWEIIPSLGFQHNDFLRAPAQLSKFRGLMRGVVEEITRLHGLSTALKIFPAIPVSCAVELGRIRMPKASMPWVIYDQNNKMNGFIETIEIKE
ncbi:MAG: SAVED domain-containing protein [Pseudomonadota bacterium]